MSAAVEEFLAMETENQQIPDSSQPQPSPGEKPATPENSETEESAANELELPQWSIVTFEGVAMGGLTYEEARQWLDKLNEQKISGLCIVTDEAASRMAE